MRYLKDKGINFVYNLIGVRKHGEKKESYKWREDLKEGDRLLFFDDAKWGEFEVVSRDENQMLEISEIIDGKVEELILEIDIYSELLA